MQAYDVELKSDIYKSYRCKRAADSLDIDVEKKSIHRLSIKADLETPFNIGLILGASGSGKTTLAKHIFGQDCFKIALDEDKPIIDQFPENYTYKQCADILTGIGLSQVPCWVRPVKTLSNGQKARAEAALSMCNDKIVLIDEFTSVVDRTIAKVMSHCIQKHARKLNKKIILLSCHYDIVDWLNPCWIIDCNKQEYIDRRLLWQSFQRTEKLEFDVKEVDRKTWGYFSKYHYLSENMPAYNIATYGLFNNKAQIGFVAFSNYIPNIWHNKLPIIHSNRVVIHPDYCGLGLGLRFVNVCCEILAKKGYSIYSKFSSIPMLQSRIKDPRWELKTVSRILKYKFISVSMRTKVKTYTFKYIGNKAVLES